MSLTMAGGLLFAQARASRCHRGQRREPFSRVRDQLLRKRHDNASRQPVLQRCDRYGPRKRLWSGVLVFVAGLLMSGLAPTMTLMVMGRAMQRFGAGVLYVALYAIVKFRTIVTQRASPKLTAKSGHESVLRSRECSKRPAYAGDDAAGPRQILRPPARVKYQMASSAIAPSTT
jgi:hypothetical protein